MNIMGQGNDGYGFMGDRRSKLVHEFIGLRPKGGRTVSHNSLAMAGIMYKPVTSSMSDLPYIEVLQLINTYK